MPEIISMIIIGFSQTFIIIRVIQRIPMEKPLELLSFSVTYIPAYRKGRNVGAIIFMAKELINYFLVYFIINDLNSLPSLSFIYITNS